MSRIRGKNTKPELAVRKLCREIGFSGYRLHRRDLPGSPDLAWIGRKTAIFVNGCFWHSHRCPKGRHRPATNESFWEDKFKKNRARDTAKIKALRAKGWRVGLIWECELKNKPVVAAKIARLLRKAK